jgi:rRNA maturation RNase YbeY
VQKKQVKIDVEINSIHDKDIGVKNLDKLVRLIWQNESRNNCEIRIILTSDEHMVELNRQFKQKDTVTDVLAFPFEETDDFFEGEIYVNVDQVCRNALLDKVFPGEELLRIAAHGTLHFAGYSDETVADKQQMTALEDFYLARLTSSPNI